MTTATKPYIRWSELDQSERVKQFVNRGTERTARAEIRTSCDFCERTINEGDRYFDINGAKYAHSSCVSGKSGDTLKHRKIITHKMVEEVAKSKSAVAPALKASKRGRKPKAVTTSNEKSAQPEPKTKSNRGRKPKSEAASKAVSAKPQKRGPKPKSEKPAAATHSINLTEVREALPGAIVTLTITGTVEAVQRALDKLQN